MRLLRIDRNLNQIAHALNAQQSTEVTSKKIEAMIKSQILADYTVQAETELKQIPTGRSYIERTFGKAIYRTTHI